MVADAFNFYHHSIAMERRSPIHCLVRYDVCFGDSGQLGEGDVSLDGPDMSGTMPPGHARSSSVNSTITSRKPRALEEFAPTATADDDPKFMRHKFVHRAIKRVMKRREEEIKARGKRWSQIKFKC